MLNFLPGYLFGTQAPNATTAAFGVVVVAICWTQRRKLRGVWGLCVATAVASILIVAAKNAAYEFVVNVPNRETDAKALATNASVLFWVGIAQLAVMLAFVLLGIKLMLRGAHVRWLGILLLAAAMASGWASWATLEWAGVFQERARNNGVGDYTPDLQVVHVVYVLVIGLLTVIAFTRWRKTRRTTLT
jgi:hypothetical protein